jgi:hypothetical protein
MKLDLAKVQANVRQATTEDLLDRATVWREDMELAALDLIDEELRVRGIGAVELEAHREQRRLRSLRSPDSPAPCCCRCQRPAVIVIWGWHRLWGLVPLFPRRFAWCEEHRPRG